MMNINVKNCRNIDEANISIEENKLNIKYGLNGTGKSSITNAIMEYIDKQNFEDLLPFKYRNLDNCEIKTQISGIPSDYKIMLFNEDYIERFVFQKDELLNNSFEVFFKTDKYEELENNIKTFTDNDLLFHLNPLEYATVPDYIIDECKKDLKQKFNLG